LFNAGVIFVAGAWYQTRLQPIVIKPKEMRRTIKSFSWNSASEWRLIEHDEKRIIIEYHLPIYQITRFELRAENFKLADKLRGQQGPFQLSYEGCDIYSRENESSKFECMKLRDLTPPDNYCPDGKPLTSN
jgi:hypothetical protein